VAAFTTSRTVSNGPLPSSHRELSTLDSPSEERDERGDERFRDRERELLVATGAHVDDEHAAVGEDRGRDVAPGESPANRVGLPVDVDCALGIDPPDERDPAAGQRQSEAAVTIAVRGERERGGYGP